MSNFGDPDFGHHVKTGAVWSNIAMAIATTPILPYNVVDYGLKIGEFFKALETDFKAEFSNHSIDLGNNRLGGVWGIRLDTFIFILDFLNKSVSDFQHGCNQFQLAITKYTTGHSMSVWQ